MSCSEIMDYLNRYLPEDIAVTSIEEVGERFHSRLNALSKTYRYRIALKKPDVFVRKYVYKTDKKPDVQKMKNASKLLLGTHDFKGFSSVKRSKKSTVRTINFINVEENDGIIEITVNGNGFLYNMVRIICGTLLETGTGEKDESIIKEIFETKERERAGVTLPACGLTLMEVYYES